MLKRFYKNENAKNIRIEYESGIVSELELEGFDYQFTSPELEDSKFALKYDDYINEPKCDRIRLTYLFDLVKEYYVPKHINILKIIDNEKIVLTLENINLIKENIIYSFKEEKGLIEYTYIGKTKFPKGYFENTLTKFKHLTDYCG